ncbi:DNA primase catalytic subunit [Mucidula mucida]|nr:DNA primase catalytic subunit [Mucidula mucida]
MSNDMDTSSPEALSIFYSRLYPFKSIFTWLNHQHAPTKLFSNREFAFTLPGDVYLRYNSFTTADELKKQVIKYNPTRFEIGPTYTHKPRDRRTLQPGKFKPLQRELVFDIDMTDYDPIRTCCSDAGICKRCWAFISAAVRVLDKSIRDQFGYQHLIWIYSGRRGIHLWISDPEAMELTDDERRAIVGWLTVVQPGKESGKKVNVRFGSKALPPSLSGIIKELADIFSDLILADQDCFASEEGYEALLQLIPDASIVHTLRTKALVKKASDRATLSAAMQDIVLQYTYPRLDAEVSKKRNHLLKAPFCVHPKTGRVCVPVDPAKVEEFDPETVPTVGQLLDELNRLNKPEHVEEGAGDEDWRLTSLRPYVEMLDNHVARIMEDVRKTKLETADMSW